MAKEQGLSLNPTKISGMCGRLMCCLKHEQDVYEEKLSRLPSIGALVKTPDGKGVVENVEVLKEVVRVKVEQKDEIIKKEYPLSEIKILKDNKKKDEEIENIKELKGLEEGFKRTDDII